MSTIANLNAVQSKEEQLKNLKAQLKDWESKQFKVFPDRLRCSCCGRKFGETKQRRIIQQEKEYFKYWKDANIKWLKAKIEEIEKAKRTTP